MTDHDDPLDAARGCFLGLALMVVFWGAVVALILTLR
jgi:hypothetical protein